MQGLIDRADALLAAALSATVASIPGLVALAALALAGLAAGRALVATIAARAEPRDAWTRGITLGVVALCVWYAAAHAVLLTRQRDLAASIDRLGLRDARRAEERTATPMGWMLDCTGADSLALARYAWREGGIRRAYASDTLYSIVGGRPYALDRLYAARLREPAAPFAAALHAPGRDLPLTLCTSLTDTASRLLAGAGTPGVVLVQEVATGAVLAWAATGAPTDAPLAARQYLIPGSVMKLATAAIWMEHGLGERVMDCPGSLTIGRYRIRNAHEFSRAALVVPRDMVVYSCNVVAAEMMLEMKERLGADEIARGYERLGFGTYVPVGPRGDERCAPNRPRGFDTTFWQASAEPVARHLSPVRSSICLGRRTRAPELAMLAIGQGPVDVSAVQVMRFVQAIGNDGVALAPTFEAALARGERPARRLMRPETARALVDAMAKVVEHGTAQGVRGELAGLGGWTLAGKTATVQRDGAPDDDGWFTGLVLDPDGRARYAVVVYLRTGGPGGGGPARIAARLTRFLAERQPGTGGE